MSAEEQANAFHAWRKAFDLAHPKYCKVYRADRLPAAVTFASVTRDEDTYSATVYKFPPTPLDSA